MPRAFVRIAVCAAALLLPAAARAQGVEDYDYENLTFSGLGADLFAVFPANTKGALALRARADLGLLGPNVRIVPSVTFWSSDLREGEVDRIESRIEDACNRGGVACPGIELGDIGISDIAFEVDGHYLWTTDFGIEPYAGIGVGLHLLNGSGDFIEDTFVEELFDGITAGAALVTGVEVPLGPAFRLQAEARGVMAGNTRWVGLGIGATWVFPAGVRRPVVPSTVPGGGR